MNDANATEIRAQGMYYQVEEGMYFGAVGVQRDKEGDNARVIAGLAHVAGIQINGRQAVRVALIEVEHSGYHKGQDYFVHMHYSHGELPRRGAVRVA